jgi:CRISPR/Cas system-associated exonuclease Cas4 (RecB family)
MDKTMVDLQVLYDEMYAELKNEIEPLDGSIDEFDPANKVISITVDPKLQEYLEGILVEITTKYENKRKELYSNDPFYGVKCILTGRH